MAEWFVPAIGIFLGAMWGLCVGTVWPMRRSLEPSGQLLITGLLVGSAVWATWANGWWFLLAFFVVTPVTAGYDRLLTRRHAHAEGRGPLVPGEADRRVTAVLNLDGWIIRRPVRLLLAVALAIAASVFLPMAIQGVAGSEMPAFVRGMHTTATIVLGSLAIVILVWFMVGPMVIGAIQAWGKAALTDAEYAESLRRIEDRAAAELAALRRKKS